MVLIAKDEPPFGVIFNGFILFAVAVVDVAGDINVPGNVANVGFVALVVVVDVVVAGNNLLFTVS